MLNHALAKVMRNFPVAARRHGLWYVLLGSLLLIGDRIRVVAGPGRFEERAPECGTTLYIVKL